MGSNGVVAYIWSPEAAQKFSKRKRIKIK